MCGITGIISKKPIDPAIIRSMTDTIAHRGPDGEGYLFCDVIKPNTPLPGTSTINSPLPLAFGHRRLAIVDLSPLGHQPMCYLDRYWIVYNGEVYNHVELREELEGLGYTFRSKTDTEVIMASYDAWGVDCLNRFNGMWAFVLYDMQESSLFLSRDRFGIKPLYYYQDEEHFIFASEIKALLKHPAVTRKPNIEYCKLFLKEGSKEHLRETAFSNIFRFEAAGFHTCHILDIFSPFRETIFWHVQPNLSDEVYDEEKATQYAQQYYVLLNDAVRLRLRADVKVGSALSGGLDSSSVVYLVNQQLRATGSEEKQETFSCVYRTPGTEYCDESAFIAEVTRSLDVRSNTIEPHVDDIIEEHRKFVYYLDTPASNTLMSSWHTYKLTKVSGVTVTLDGQGADEQLAGYNSYLLYHFATLPMGILIRELRLYSQVPKTSKIIIKGFALNVLQCLLGERSSSFLLRCLGKKFDYMPVNQKLAEDLILSLGTLFHWADSGSMAFSIESRMPFMDYRLVEFLAMVPATYKIYGGWTKHLARMAFDGRLPGTITWRRDKMGWPIPEEYWFNGELKDHLILTLKDSEVLLSIGVDFSDTNEPELFERHSFGYLLRCYVLETWHQVFWGKTTIPHSPDFF